MPLTTRRRIFVACAVGKLHLENGRFNSRDSLPEIIIVDAIRSIRLFLLMFFSRVFKIRKTAYILNKLFGSIHGIESDVKHKKKKFENYEVM